MKKILFGILIFLILIQSAYSAVPNTFTNGTIADADDVNENFTYFENKFSTTSGHDHDSSDSKILTVLGTITTGEWKGTVVDEIYGGTGFTGYASGDMLYASSDTGLVKLVKPNYSGSMLLYSHTSSTPYWLKPGATGDILMSNGLYRDPIYTNQLPASLITSEVLNTARLGTGTADSTTFLRGDGIWTGATLSNIVFSFALGGGSGGADLNGVVMNDDITPNDLTGITPLFWCVSGDAYRTIIISKFKKIAGISTVTVYASIWVATAGRQAMCQVTIGSASGSVTGTASQFTPEWKNFSIDVSGLTNGTVYDVTIQLKQDNGAANPVMMDSIIGIAS